MASAWMQTLALAVKHALPLVPPDVGERIRARAAEVERVGEQMSPEQVREALREIGKEEWPYRRAFAACVAAQGFAWETAFFLEACSPALLAKVEGLGVRDVPLREWSASRLIEEQCTAQERLEMEQAMEQGREQLRAAALANVAQGGAWQDMYAKELAREQAAKTELESTLAKLHDLVAIDEHWGPEIQAQWEAFEDGWSVTERDAEPADVARALDYWQRLLTVGE
jgi:hypothetical protein